MAILVQYGLAAGEFVIRVKLMGDNIIGMYVPGGVFASAYNHVKTSGVIMDNTVQRCMFVFNRILKMRGKDESGSIERDRGRLVI